MGYGSIYCSESVHTTRYRTRPCGKPVKDEGLCGVHLAAKRRVQANNAKREAALKIRMDRYTNDQAASKTYARELGFEVRVTGGSVTVSRANFDELLRQFNALKVGK